MHLGSAVPSDTVGDRRLGPSQQRICPLEGMNARQKFGRVAPLRRQCRREIRPRDHQDQSFRSVSGAPCRSRVTAQPSRLYPCGGSSKHGRTRGIGPRRTAMRDGKSQGSEPNPGHKGGVGRRVIDDIRRGFGHAFADCQGLDDLMELCVLGGIGRTGPDTASTSVAPERSENAVPAKGQELGGRWLRSDGRAVARRSGRPQRLCRPRPREEDDDVDDTPAHVARDLRVHFSGTIA